MIPLSLSVLLAPRLGGWGSFSAGWHCQLGCCVQHPEMD